MRKILVIMSIVLMGCDNNLIISKKYDSAPCICTYEYILDVDQHYTFQDSCNKYNVGQVIPQK